MGIHNENNACRYICPIAQPYFRPDQRAWYPNESRTEWIGCLGSLQNFGQSKRKIIACRATQTAPLSGNGAYDIKSHTGIQFLL